MSWAAARARFLLLLATLQLASGALGCEEAAPAPGGAVLPSSHALSAKALRSAASLPGAKSAAPKRVAPRGSAMPAKEPAITDDLKLVDAVSIAARLTPAGRMKLLDAGKAPRVKRTVAPERLPLTARLSVVVTMTVAGKRQLVPALHVKLRLTPPQSADERDIWQLRVLEVSARRLLSDTDAAAAGEPAAAPEIAGLYRALEGQTTTLTWAEMGGLTLARPAKLSVEAGQLWASLVEGLQEAAVLWPREAIGVGARWRVFERGFRAGMPVLRQRDFKLLREQDAVLTLEEEIREVGLDDGARDPALPAEVSVTPYAAQTDAAATLELRQGMPLAQRMRGSLRTNATVVIAAQAKHNDVVLEATPSPPTALAIRQLLSLELDGAVALPASSSATPRAPR